MPRIADEIEQRAAGVALLNLGIVETWSGRLADAERHLDRGGRARPGRSAGPTWRSRAGRIRASRPGPSRSRRRASAAVQAVALAERYGLEDRPILAPALGAVGGMAIWMGEFDEGERWLRRAWEVASAHVEPAAAVLLHVATGMLHAGRGQHQPALDAFAAAAHAQSLLTGVHALAPRIAGWLAAAQARLGRLDEASATLYGFSAEPERMGAIGNARAVIAWPTGTPPRRWTSSERSRQIRPARSRSSRRICSPASRTSRWGIEPPPPAAAEAALAAAEPDRLMFPFAMTGAAELLDALPRHADCSRRPARRHRRPAARRVGARAPTRNRRSSAGASCASCATCRRT